MRPPTSTIFNLYTDTADIPTRPLSYGPTGDGFHAPDEYVDVDGLVGCTKFLAVAILDFCASDELTSSTARPPWVAGRERPIPRRSDPVRYPRPDIP